MKKKQVVVQAMALFLGMALATGCAPKNADTTSAQETTAESSVAEESKASEASADQSEAESKDQQDPADYGTVEIQNGERTVTFTKMPEKVLCANLYAAENMVMLGLGDRVVGRNVSTSAADKPLPELEAQFEKIPQIEKSNENAVALGTDLVIGQISAFKDGSWGSYEQFENEGINCLTITGTIVQDETVEDVYTDIRNLGKIFKVEDKAEELVTEIQDQIAEVETAVKDVPEDTKVKAFVLDTFKGNEIYTTSKGLESNLIELAGGVNCTRNMADSRWFNTSVETLVETNPDVIIINDYGTQTVEEKLDFLKSNPALSEVPAVKNENYLIIPLVEVMQDVRAASACKKFAQHFYPKCFE